MFARSFLLAQGPASRRLASAMPAAASRSFAVSNDLRPALWYNAFKNMADACTMNDEAGNLALQVDMIQPVSVSFTPETTLKEIGEQIQASQTAEAGKAISLRFTSLTGSVIPQSEKIKHHQEFPVLMAVNDEEIHALNFSTAFKLDEMTKFSKDIHNEIHFSDFSRDIGLRGYERYAIPAACHALMATLPSKKEVSAQEILDSMQIILRNNTTKIVEGRQDVGSIQAEIDELDRSTGEIAEKIQGLKVSASRKASAVCYLGSMWVLGQFGLISMGTFDWYSWDIMEPVAYLMSLFNMTGGYMFYIGMKRDLTHTNFHDILTQRFTEGACRRAGIDLAQYEADLERLKDLREGLREITWR